jgi:hypothetical protein
MLETPAKQMTRNPLGHTPVFECVACMVATDIHMLDVRSTGVDDADLESDSKILICCTDFCHKVVCRW